MNKQHIFFNPGEVTIIALGLGRIMEDLNAMKLPEWINTPWTPEARKQQKDMIAAAKSAAAKIEKFTGIKCHLPEYKPGDEDEFLTKES